MYSLTWASSKPTVDTSYPRAHNLSPLKFRCRPPKCLATAMALFPLIYPTTSATKYFGGFSPTHAHDLEPCAPPLLWTLFVMQVREIFLLRIFVSSYRGIFSTFWDKHYMILATPFGMGQALVVH